MTANSTDAIFIFSIASSHKALYWQLEGHVLFFVCVPSPHLTFVSRLTCCMANSSSPTHVVFPSLFFGRQGSLATRSGTSARTIGSARMRLKDGDFFCVQNPACYLLERHMALSLFLSLSTGRRGVRKLRGLSHIKASFLGEEIQ